jgi:hypothetical protein
MELLLDDNKTNRSCFLAGGGNENTPDKKAPPVCAANA